MKLPKLSCELASLAKELGYPPCQGPMTFEHILSKSMFRGNKEGLKLAYDVYGDYFGATTCYHHNVATRFAETKEAKLFLMRKRLRENPEVMPLAIEEVAATFTSPPHYLRLEYLQE